MPAIGLNVGKAVAYLELDTSNFSKGFQTAKTELSGFTDKTSSTSDRIKSLGSTFTSVGSTLNKGITVPLAGVGTAAVKAGMNFEQGMAQVGAISGKVSNKDLPGIIKTAEEMGLSFEKSSDATQTAMNALSAKAIEMGAKTKFSATESAEAMSYMAMAGWKTEDMLKGIEPVMNLAAASGENLATVSDIVTDAMTAFGMSADETTRFVDVLSAASANSNTNVSMLGESFKYVAPVAGALGYNVEDTSIALGLMANSGIKATQSGTALRTLLTNMSKPTKDMQIAMDTLGVSLTDEEGNMKSLREVMNELRSGFGQSQMSSEDFNNALVDLNGQLERGELTQEQYDQALQDLTVSAYGVEGAERAKLAAMLAGKEGMSGLLAIVNATEEDYNKLTGAIDSSNGATQDMVDIMMNTLQGAFDIFKSSLETAGIQISDVLIPIVREFAEWLTGLVTWFTNLNEGTQAFIIKAGLLLAALGPVLTVVGNLTKLFGGMFDIVTKFPGVIGALSKVFSGLWGVMTAHPILALIAVIGTLILTNKDLQEVLKKVWNIIKEVVINSVKDAIDWIGNLGKKIKDFFTGADKDTEEHKKKQKQHNKEIKEDTEKQSKEAGEALVKNTKKAHEDVDKDTKESNKKQKQLNKEWKEDVDKQSKEAGDKKVKNVKTANDSVKKSTTEFRNDQKNQYNSWKTDTTKTAKETGDNRIKEDDRAWKTIDGQTKTGVSNLIGQFVSMGGNITKTTKETGDKNAENIKSGNDRALASTNEFATASQRTIGGWGQFIVKTGTDTSNSLRASIDNGRKGVVTSFELMRNTSFYLLQGMASSMSNLGANIMNGFLGGLQSRMSAVTSFFSGVAKSVSSAVASIGSYVSSAINGSHANGLEYVPYDGYVAELHKGERVLTKQENEAYSKSKNVQSNNSGKVNSSGDTFNFYNTKPEPYEYYRQMKKAKRELYYNT